MKKQRPDIYSYHDYQTFLTDWFAFRKASQSEFSMRWLAKQAGLASGYLSMVLSRKRPLAGAASAKLLPFLGLNASELSFFENLLVLGNSDSHDARLAALERMRRFQKFQKSSSHDAEVFEYLTHWYFVAIREMAAMPGFEATPDWIQRRLRFAVPLKEVTTALDFLLQNGYILKAADGSVTLPEKDLNCSGGIYRVALAKFHNEIFSLAGQSIENTPSEERNIQGYTCKLDAEKFMQAKEIVNEALRKIQELGEAKTSDRKGSEETDAIYHLELALFPLTQKGSAT